MHQLSIDARALTIAAPLPGSGPIGPVLLGTASFVVGFVLLMLVMTVPDGDDARKANFSPAAVSFSRSLLVRTAEQSSVYLESASVRDEPPLPEPPPAPLPIQVQKASAPVLSRQQAVSKGREMISALTFYDCLGQRFCGAMSNGQKVYEGAAACSYNLATGTTFVIHGDPTGRVYVCKDRGLLPNTHVDIFWNDPADGWRWQAAVGIRGTIQSSSFPSPSRAGC